MFSLGQMGFAGVVAGFAGGYALHSDYKGQLLSFHKAMQREFDLMRGKP
jgi:hypothetical protein